MSHIAIGPRKPRVRGPARSCLNPAPQVGPVLMISCQPAPAHSKRPPKVAQRRHTGKVGLHHMKGCGASAVPAELGARTGRGLSWTLIPLGR
jgi:hypothetical protein